jgi:hypothetical protein
MTRKELKERVRKNISEADNTISTKTGLEVAKIVTKIANAEGVSWAIVGGLAMHLYGFVRATTDIDFISDKNLSLTAERYLSFGGARYSVEIKDRAVPVEWIIRRDRYKRVFELALAEAIELNGWLIVSPEWLVIMKYIAGRPKDETDLIWLAQQPRLVNRQQVRRNLQRAFGEDAGDIIFYELIRRPFALADGTRIKDGDENETYISLDEYPEYND